MNLSPGLGNAPMQGWAFRPVYLPEGLSGDVPKIGGEPARILIVEDDFLIAMSIEDVARQMGMQVVGIATASAEAQRLCAAEKPDFATMDIRLADGESGIETARTLQHEHGVRSLFVSAFCHGANRRASEDSQPLGWISKPFTTAQLATAFRMAVKQLQPE